MKSFKILYVEDYPVVQAMYLDVLKKHNFAVDAVNDGKEALQKAAKNEYDVVLLDLLLPQVSGVEFLREFRKTHPDTEVIVLSDFDYPETVKEIASLGVKHYWIKVDNTPHVMAEKLQEVLNKQQKPAKP